MSRESHPLFVANDSAGTRRETATLLVGTADSFGISQRSIRSTRSGFYITEELAEAVYGDADEPEAEEVEEPSKPAKKTTSKKSSTKKTSGNRAAKNTGTEEE